MTEHGLGPLADPHENLAPVAVVADSQGALAAWIAPGGLALRRLNASGAPEGAEARVPGTWQSVPTLLLSPQEAILVATTPSEITVSRFVRSSLQPLSERRVPRPKELAKLVATTLDGADLWLIGARERALTFFRVGRETAPHSATVPLPKAIPEDALATTGRRDGSLAVLISTIGGETWLAAETGVQSIAPGDAPPASPGRFVRPLPIELRTGATSYGLQTVPSYPLSRREDARLLEETPTEAFRTRGTYGFPATAWTGTHFLFAEAMGEWETGKMDRLSAVVSAVDCRGN